MSEYREINFKKKFGQNFLSDKNLLSSIVRDASITKDDVVLEIGAGAGALTEFLVSSAKKVVSFEVDNELEKVLAAKFSDSDNIKIVYEDFLKVEEQELYSLLGCDFKVVANLPYYITSPIITKLCTLKHRPKVIVIMVQKEVGERITARAGHSDYGYFSAFISANADSKVVRNVNRKMFTPVPNVDSCIVRLDLKDNGYNQDFFEFLKQAFKMKRKTLVNNLSASFDKTKVITALNSLKLDNSIRAEAIDIEQFYKLYELIS